MAKSKSAADNAAKWSAGMGRAGAAWIAGAQGTNKDPTALASSTHAMAKAAQNYADAAKEGGRMQQGLQRAGKAGWLNGIVTAGAAALTQGARKGAQKLNGPIGQQLFQAQQSASQAAAGAGDSSTARWSAAVNAMRQAFGKGPVS